MTINGNSALETGYDGVVLLGAGLSGLGCARQLPGARIYEAQAYAGGHARSHAAGGFHFDEGAHICHSRDQNYLDMVFESAGEVKHVATSNVVNRREGKWITYPVQNHLHELEPQERAEALIGFVNAQIERAGIEPRHYLDWCLNQYGEFLTEKFYALYTAKYWRTPMEELATDWLSGRLLPSQVNRVIAGAIAAQPDDQAVFAAFHYPERGGYFGFFNNLYEGLNITLNARAVEIDASRRFVTFANGERQDFTELVSSISLPSLVGMIKDAPSSVREAASLLRHTQLLCVNLVINRPRLTDLHWFYIYDEEIEASRVSVASNLGNEPAAAEKTALQAEIFRRDDEQVNVEQLVENTIEHLTKALGFSREEIETVKPVLVPHAYIISDLRRAGAVQHIHEWLAGQGIHCTGLLGKWRFIWSDAAFRDGVATAQEVMQTRK
jgi:protoporphyrinogen oxidase